MFLVCGSMFFNVMLFLLLLYVSLIYVPLHLWLSECCNSRYSMAVLAKGYCLRMVKCAKTYSIPFSFQLIVVIIKMSMNNVVLEMA